MGVPDAAMGSNLDVLRGLSEGLLRSAGRTGVRGNLLEIHHPAGPLVDPALLQSPTGYHGVSISLSQHDDPEPGRRVSCESAQLPFQDRVFCMVILHHVIGAGDKAELAEAVRVTARTGVLILLGLNRMGWRYRSQNAIRRLPGIAPFKVKSRLEELGMTMQGYAGAGLGGRQRPGFICGGLGSLALPLADLVLLQARHQDGPEATSLRLRKHRTGVVQSAPMRG